MTVHDTTPGGPEKSRAVPQGLADELLEYLKSKPWSEVNDLIGRLCQCPSVTVVIPKVEIEQAPEGAGFELGSAVRAAVESKINGGANGRDHSGDPPPLDD